MSRRRVAVEQRVAKKANGEPGDRQCGQQSLRGDDDGTANVSTPQDGLSICSSSRGTSVAFLDFEGIVLLQDIRVVSL